MHIDYISFTFKKPSLEILRPDDLVFTDISYYDFNIVVETILQNCFEDNIILRSCKAGLYNYSRSFDICIDRTFESERIVIPIGKLAHGGNNDSCYISLTGKACAMLDFSSLYMFILDLNNIKITRIDIAHDFYNSFDNTYNFEYFVNAYKNELFKSHMSRCNPKNQMIGDFLTEGSPEGRTLYVGDRKSPKFVRIYEKGKESKSVEFPHWIRFEIEFKSSDKNVIPLESLIAHRDFFLSAYPICSIIDYPTEILKISRSQIEVLDGCKHRINNLKKQYGQTLNYLINYMDIDINSLIKPGISKSCKDLLLYGKKVGPSDYFKNHIDLGIID